MNSLERVKTAIKHKEPDVVPVGPMIGNHAAYINKIKLIDYYTKGNVMAQAQYSTWEIYGQDIVLALSDNYYIAEGFGCEVDFHENSTPTLRKPAISSIKQIFELKVPNPYTDGRMPVYLEAIEILKDKLQSSVCIRGTGTGPFSLASHLMGTQNFLVSLAEAEYNEDKDAQKCLFELMEKTTEALVKFCKAQFEAGACIVQCGDSLASIDMISPALYKKYVFPFEQKVFDELKPYTSKYEGYTLLHICGDNTKVMELHAKTGADIIEVDSKVDIGLFKRLAGDKICLMGNINPVDTLLNGTPDIVAKESELCIEKAAKGGGFILGSGCEVPIGSPVENIKSLVDTARRFRYS